MKSFISVILSLFAVCLITANAYAYSDECSAKAAVLYQPDTQTALFEKNMHDKNLIASTTKVLTAIVVLENTDIKEIVDIRHEYTTIEGSSMGLKPGERFTVEELLYGMLLESGNDAAYALACHTAGDIESFAVLMNIKAEDLGCSNSCFANPHGLDDDNHYSSAYDLAVIMSAAIKNDTFVKISGTKNIEIAGSTLTNHNKLLWSYDGISCGKTGYTTAAGRILVSACEKDGMELICVTIDDKNDWHDHAKLYDWGYEEYKLVRIENEFNIPVISGKFQYAQASCENMIFLTDKEAQVEIEYIIPKFVYAPVNDGENAGYVRYFSGEDDIAAVVRFSESVSLDDSIYLTIWENIKWSWQYYNKHSGNIPFVPMY